MPISKILSDSFASGVGGKVLQVVYADSGSSSNVAFSNSGWTSMAITALITPSSTSNKILVDFAPQFRMQIGNADVGMGWRVLRNGSAIETTTTTYNTYFYANGGYIDSRGISRVIV